MKLILHIILILVGLTQFIFGTYVAFRLFQFPEMMGGAIISWIPKTFYILLAAIGLAVTARGSWLIHKEHKTE